MTLVGVGTQTAEPIRRVAVDYGGCLVGDWTTAGADGDAPVWLAAAAALRRLHDRGLRLVLASNMTANDRERRRPALARTGIEAVFAAVVLSHEVRVRKPDAWFYATVVRMAACTAGEVLFVDNRARYVQAAVDFGMRAVLVDKGGTQPAAMGVPVLRHVPQLPDLLEASR